MTNQEIKRYMTGEYDPRYPHDGGVWGVMLVLVLTVILSLTYDSDDG